MNSLNFGWWKKYLCRFAESQENVQNIFPLSFRINGLTKLNEARASLHEWESTERVKKIHPKHWSESQTEPSQR